MSTPAAASRPAPSLVTVPLRDGLVPLALLSAFAVALFYFRRGYSGQVHYHFLLWNLFLAWVPYGLSTLMVTVHVRGRRGALLLPLALAWLVFFPNAPYIVTDLVNMTRGGGMPLWYDVALLSAFGWSGLFLGYFSLHQVQRIVEERTQRRLVGWLAAGATLIAASFGIYLGRSLRWNSWDVVQAPSQLAGDVVEHVARPHAHPGAWGLTLVFGALLGLGYLVFRTITRLPHAERSG